MAGISVQHCISLILKYIGGMPQIPNIRTITEGTLLPKYNGFGSFSSLGVGQLNSILGGLDPSAALGEVFQNPVGDVTLELETSISDAASAVPGLSSIGVSAESISNLTDKLTSLTESIGNYSNITSVLSGVSDANFDLTGQGLKTFDFSSALSGITSLQILKNTVPLDLQANVVGFSENVDNCLNSIISPLQQGDYVGDINDYVSNLVSNIQSSVNPELAAIAAIDALDGHYSNVTNIVESAAYNMSNIQSAMQFTSTIGTITHAIVNNADSPSTNTLVNLIVTPSTIASITEDVAKYGNSTGITVPDIAT